MAYNPKEVSIGIRVLYKDGTFHTVNKAILDKLIESGEIIAFRRSSGWAIIGVNTLRERGTVNVFAEQDRLFN